jgi:hypothetical protein
MLNISKQKHASAHLNRFKTVKESRPIIKNIE